MLGTDLLVGSLPEELDDKIYNTSPSFSPDGNLVALHRKVRPACLLSNIWNCKTDAELRFICSTLTCQAGSDSKRATPSLAAKT